MLFAASVKVSLGKNQRRLDLVIEAETIEAAQEKAIKQARKIYAPGKKALYTITQIINEADAYQTLASGPPQPAAPVETEEPAEPVPSPEPVSDADSQ